MSWVLELSVRDARALAPLRLVPGVEVCLARGALWVRGREESGQPAALRSVPAQRRHAVIGDQLVPQGARLAVGAVPDGPWTPLADWLMVELGTLALPAERPAPVPLRVTRDLTGAPVEPTLLSTTAGAWRRWASTASSLRLGPLRFAVSADGRVLVRGQPLPPLPGLRWREAEGVAVPCGHRWTPPVDAATAAVALGLLPGDLALLHPDGDFERLDASAFVSATRAAVLASTGGGPDA